MGSPNLGSIRRSVRQSHHITTGKDEHIENVVKDRCLGRAVVPEDVERRSSRFIQRYYFPVNDCIVR